MMTSYGLVGLCYYGNYVVAVFYKAAQSAYGKLRRTHEYYS